MRGVGFNCLTSDFTRHEWCSEWSPSGSRAEKASAMFELKGISSGGDRLDFDGGQFIESKEVHVGQTDRGATLSTCPETIPSKEVLVDLHLDPDVAAHDFSLNSSFHRKHHSGLNLGSSRLRKGRSRRNRSNVRLRTRNGNKIGRRDHVGGTDDVCCRDYICHRDHIGYQDDLVDRRDGGGY